MGLLGAFGYQSVLGLSESMLIHLFIQLLLTS